MHKCTLLKMVREAQQQADRALHLYTYIYGQHPTIHKIKKNIGTQSGCLQRIGCENPSRSFLFCSMSLVRFRPCFRIKFRFDFTSTSDLRLAFGKPGPIEKSSEYMDSCQSPAGKPTARRQYNLLGKAPGQDLGQGPI